MVIWEPPAPDDVRRAAEIYIGVAYDGEPPAAVKERLLRLRSARDREFYGCEAFERGEDCYSLRLGNRFYPHMKLVLKRGSAGRTYFVADTHDRHVLALVGNENPDLNELIERNAAIARDIERSWSASGLPTVSSDWRERLDRWRTTHQ